MQIHIICISFSGIYIKYYLGMIQQSFAFQDETQELKLWVKKM